MRTFVVLLTTLLLPLSASAFAAPSIPPQPVWSTPAESRAGESVKLNAFVFNDSDEPVTITVDFVVQSKVVATAPSTLLPVETAKVVSASWQTPKDKTLVTAVVRSALTKSKEHKETLEGTIGTVTITPSTPPVQIANTLNQATSSVDGVRTRGLEYFTDLKARAQKTAGETTLNEIGSLVNPPKAGDGEQIPAHTGAYLKYLYASAGKALFANKTAFYGVVALLAFLVVRFVFGRLFRR